MRIFFLCTLFLLSSFGLWGQSKPSPIQGEWVSKYGFYVNANDLSQKSVPSQAAEKCTIMGDTFCISYVVHYTSRMVHTDTGDVEMGDSQYVPENALFRISGNKDSLSFTPLNSQAWKIHSEYSQLSYSSDNFVHFFAGLNDHFPNKTKYHDRLVLYPMRDLYKEYVWDTLYFSILDMPVWYVPGRIYDLSISKSGTLRMDEQYSEDKLKKHMRWKNRSSLIQLSPQQMDTIRHLLNMSNVMNLGSSSWYCFHSSEYKLKLNSDTTIISWLDCNRYTINVTPLAKYIEKILASSSGDKIPFTGFHSPCTFVEKSKRRLR